MINVLSGTSHICNQQRQTLMHSSAHLKHSASDSYPALACILTICVGFCLIINGWMRCSGSCKTYAKQLTKYLPWVLTRNHLLAKHLYKWLSDVAWCLVQERCAHYALPSVLQCMDGMYTAGKLIILLSMPTSTFTRVWFILCIGKLTQHGGAKWWDWQWHFPVFFCQEAAVVIIAHFFFAAWLASCALQAVCAMLHYVWAQPCPQIQPVSCLFSLYNIQMAIQKALAHAMQPQPSEVTPLWDSQHITKSWLAIARSLASECTGLLKQVTIHFVKQTCHGSALSYQPFCTCAGHSEDCNCAAAASGLVCSTWLCFWFYRQRPRQSPMHHRHLKGFSTLLKLRRRRAAESSLEPLKAFWQCLDPTQ